MSEPIRVAIVGADGRVGRALVRLAASEGLSIVGAVTRSTSPELGKDAGEVAGIGTLGVQIGFDLASGLLGAACVIDFSSAETVSQVAHVAARAGVAVVSGTTGIGPDAERALDEAAKRVPVLWSANMSVGVFVLAQLVKQAVKSLPGFDVEIVETHHRNKVDAPSGTAKILLRAVQDVREARAISGREGKPGARLDDEVAMLAMRGGDVVGDHTVHLLGQGERIELTHRATNRDLFALGALRAARAITKREPGRYTMADVLE
ncbi:MAG: 4-hydroxy-tetrahydrodipicolinate reductase [Polyangiaceae bacterium]|nr:4-hydroxy-tetrahydrodipicolinate reductase [Polyangiaceae bacterium]